MLTQKDQKTIRSRLDKIYKTFLSKKILIISKKKLFKSFDSLTKKILKKNKVSLRKLLQLFVMVTAYILKEKNQLKYFKAFFKKN